MKRIVSISLILLCSLASAASASDAASDSVSEQGWRLDKDKDGIKIYTRPFEGSDFREVRGTVQIQGRLSSVVALLQDVSYWPKLNELFSMVRIHGQKSETEALWYYQMDMPWPLKDRDVLNHRKIEQDAGTKVVTMTTVATTGVVPEEDGYVRIVQSTQQWTLTPNASGGVDVNWVTHTDPNGPIPSTMANWLITGPPFDSVTVLRKAIESGEYADAQLPYIQEPNPANPGMATKSNP